MSREVQSCSKIAFLHEGIWHDNKAESFGVPIDIDLSAIEDQLGGQASNWWNAKHGFPWIRRFSAFRKELPLSSLICIRSIFCSSTPTWRLSGCWSNWFSERKSELNRTDMNRIIKSSNHARLHGFIVAHRGIPLIRLPPWLLRALSPWLKVFKKWKRMGPDTRPRRVSEFWFKDFAFFTFSGSL